MGGILINFRISLILSFIFLLLFTPFLFSIPSEDCGCLIPINDCTNSTLIDEGKFCDYQVDYNYVVSTTGYKEIKIEVIQGGMYGADRDFSFDLTNSNDNLIPFSVWVDKTTQPTYILCKGIDASNDYHLCGQIVLGNENVHFDSNKTYTTYNSDDSLIKYIGILIIIISIFSAIYLVSRWTKN